MPYPYNPDMDFACDCPVYERRNVWNDFTGVHVRFCPMCGARAEQFYEPTQTWEETGQGKAGRPMPEYMRADRAKAAAVRASGVHVRKKAPR